MSTNAKSSNECSSAHPSLPQVVRPLCTPLLSTLSSPENPEKLQAISSLWTSWINSVNAEFVTSKDGLQETLGISGKHASGYHALSHIAYCCSHLPKKQTMPTFTTLSKFLDQETSPPKNLQRDMADVMKKFTEIATTEKLRFGFSTIHQKVAPVEFVYIGLSFSPLLHAHGF